VCFGPLLRCFSIEWVAVKKNMYIRIILLPRTKRNGRTFLFTYTPKETKPRGNQTRAISSPKRAISPIVHHLAFSFF
jgi:hypothetical protein